VIRGRSRGTTGTQTRGRRSREATVHGKTRGTLQHEQKSGRTSQESTHGTTGPGERGPTPGEEKREREVEGRRGTRCEGTEEGRGEAP